MTVDTKVQTLADFLLARIAEDEAAADEWHNRMDDDLRLLEFFGECHCDGKRRVLAECEAKRAIVGRHDRVTFTDVRLGLVGVAVCCRCHVVLDDEDHDFPFVQEVWPCATIRALAAVYADHPDYRQEWTL